MKRTTKLLSILLAAIMLLGMLPLGMLTASAAGETTIPDMPKSYPAEGDVQNLQGIGLSPKLADFGTKVDDANSTKMIDSASTANVTIQDGKARVASNNSYTTVFGSGKQSNGTANTKWNFRYANGAWLGASGIMFYLEVKNTSDGTENTTDAASFSFDFSVENAARNGTAHFASVPGAVSDGSAKPEGWRKVKGNAEYYTYDSTANTWTKQVPADADARENIGVAGSRWYFIPFSSFYLTTTHTYGTISATMADSAWGMSFTEYAERFNATLGNIYNFALRQEAGKNTTLVFNDIYTVYPPATEAASPNAATVEMFPDFRINNDPENGTVASITDGVLTVSNTTNNNTTNTSNQRVWVKNYDADAGSTAERIDITKASGIRFHVDSRNLEEGQQLILRVRMIDNLGPNGLKENNAAYQFITGAANGTTTSTSASTIQFKLQSANSVVYVEGENEDGQMVPCRGGENKQSMNTHQDYVLLPAEYEGDVYIPMSSFYAYLGGSWGTGPVVDFETATSLGLGNTWVLGIVQCATGTMAANCEIKYSNFELVYDEIEATQTAVSMGNDLALRVKTETKDGATVESAAYKLGDNTVAAKVNAITGGYEIACDGILPQNVGEQITVTINGKVGGKAVTNTVTTSVKDYCLKLIANNEASVTAKNAAADLLRYANAAQVFAAGETTIEKPILDTATQTAISTLGQKTDFDALTLTKGSVKGNTSLAGYDMTGAAIRLDNALALKLFVAVPNGNTKAVTASVTMGTKTPVELTVIDGACVFGGIGACDLRTSMTVTLKVDGTEVQTLTYSMNDYFADALANSEIKPGELTLVQALYDYCVSATAYANSLS